jgi:hypothetical protein
MNLIDLRDLQLLMLVGMFMLGGLTFITGVLILVSGAWGRELRSITSQTARLAQKGLTEEISGLVGNASNLMNTINEMVRTATGIGVFLTVFGGILMSITCWLILTMS